jgi:lipopolysaccharide/colanic/teichoic acid biosynthesis glycosyltransferase
VSEQTELPRTSAKAVRQSESRDRGLTRRGLSLLLSWASLFIGFIVLPVGYYGTIFMGRTDTPPAPELWCHVVLVCAANTFAMVATARFIGRTDRNISTALTSFLIAHGAVAFLTLAFRLYYSNQLMLASTIVSIIVPFAFILMKAKLAPHRVALIGTWQPLAERLKAACDHFDGEPQDLSAYDVVLVTDATPSEAWAPAISRAMVRGRTVRHLAEYLEEERGIVSDDHFHLEDLPRGGLTSYKARKRAGDIVLTLLIGLCGAPFLALGMLVVFVTMGRPIFFVQTRVGMGGESFRMFKLRTMTTSAVDRADATGRGDRRVTPLGALLRRFRIDELPQLWNVLKGDMSLIGPRPEQVALTVAYTKDLPAFAYRHLVRPGITGWAQVRAGYAADLAETKVKLSYDLYYLKYFSASLDLQIVFRTVVILLTGRGVR